MKVSFSILVTVALAIASNIGAYFVGPALSLEEIAKQSDIIFKGTCISSKEIQDEWFKPLSGFQSFETEFKVTSVIKGESVTGMLRFRHYGAKLGPGPITLIGYSPQSYHFEPGKIYLVFAKSTEVAWTYRQIWAAHTGKADQGAFQCADTEPPEADNIKEVVWSEMQKMLQRNRPEDVLYGIRQLGEMSNNQVDRPNDEFFDAHHTTKDFDRLKVLSAILPLTKCENDEIAQQAIAVIASRNPYMTEDGIHHWLATRGDRDAFGIGKMDPSMKNPGGTLYQTELVAIADDRNRNGKTRATAIQALGLVRGATLIGSLKEWLKDSEPAVRSAASLLLADAPRKEGGGLLQQVVNDEAAEVRTCTAYAIGIGQHAEYVETLGNMLQDPDAKVRRAASMSLLAFPPKNSAVTAILKANIDNKEFRPLFLNALASESIEPYLEPIAKVVEEKSSPTNWSGGTIPAFTSWKLLFKYLQRKSTKELRSGQLDRYLDALETGYFSGSEPTMVYAFYLQRGMKERAGKLREEVKKRVSYDMNLYFNRVDADPKGTSIEP